MLSLAFINDIITKRSQLLVLEFGTNLEKISPPPFVFIPGYFKRNKVENRVSIVKFIVANTVEFVNVTMNMTMNPTNSNKASGNKKKKKVFAPNEN